MLSSTYLVYKSLKMNIFHINITKWACIFKKVGEWAYAVWLCCHGRICIQTLSTCTCYCQAIYLMTDQFVSMAVYAYMPYLPVTARLYIWWWTSRLRWPYMCINPLYFGLPGYISDYGQVCCHGWLYTCMCLTPVYFSLPGYVSRVRSWNDGMSCMSLDILLKTDQPVAINICVYRSCLLLSARLHNWWRTSLLPWTYVCFYVMYFSQPDYIIDDGSVYCHDHMCI